MDPSNKPVVGLRDRDVSAETIHSCRQGDRDALRTIYETYKDRVYSIALYFFHGDTAAAADATQEVFLKVITAIRQFRGDAVFSTWLYRLVVNTCMDGVRQRKWRTAAASERLPESLVQPGSQEEELVRARMAACVQSAVSMLPPKFRMAILLRYFEGLSYEEMAAVLNCSMGTVASRLSRGHRILAEKLRPLQGCL